MGKVKEFDLGLDFSVLSNRINLTADFYHRLSDGQIMDRIVPVETGETKATFMSVQFVIPELN